MNLIPEEIKERLSNILEGMKNAPNPLVVMLVHNLGMQRLIHDLQFPKPEITGERIPKPQPILEIEDNR